MPAQPALGLRRSAGRPSQPEAPGRPRAMLWRMHADRKTRRGRRTPLLVAAVCALLLLGRGGATGRAQESLPGRGGRRGPVQIGSIIAAPAQLTTGQLTVPAGTDAGTFIPITIIHGAKHGPILAVVAGVHGSETTPILALQQMAGRQGLTSTTTGARATGASATAPMDPMQLAGTVVLVHVANVPSFLGRSVYVSPGDRKNLNRQFPGRADGTVSERIADVLTRDVIARADFVIDVHSGDANEDLRPWTGFYAKYGSTEVIGQSRAMAVAFGVDLIVEFPFSPKPGESTRYLGATAVSLGKPSFDVEVGRLGRIEPESTATITRGLFSVLRHLQMLPGTPKPAAKPRFVTERRELEAEQDGLFYPLVKAGAVVTAGTRLGFITDFHGARVQEVTAPESGTVLTLVATPAISRGETIATLAVK